MSSLIDWNDDKSIWKIGGIAAAGVIGVTVGYYMIKGNDGDGGDGGGDDVSSVSSRKTASKTIDEKMKQRKQMDVETVEGQMQRPVVKNVRKEDLSEVGQMLVDVRVCLEMADHNGAEKELEGKEGVVDGWELLEQAE
eukprot:TRINITY_DN485_c0_g2_i1.p1 TRINITY_DN485_c0_g2~~TRINITY_DN485_c0_g2_i1.p1  ORF type:complete len:138 (+),score=29.39 TRINITY_DN485_c0_g2_i1:121-534(+)